MVSGLSGMIVALVIGAIFSQLPVQFAVLVLWAASQFVVSPALEALVTEGESGTARAHLVGVYSVVWAACSAAAYFFGGGLFERLGSGSIFWVPPGLHLLQLAVLWGYARDHWKTPATPSPQPPLEAEPLSLKQGPNPQAFQRMAWIANPFACVAAFTLLAMMGAGNLVGPGVAALGLLIFPQSPHIGVWAVSGLLALGMGALLRMRLHSQVGKLNKVSNP